MITFSSWLSADPLALIPLHLGSICWTRTWTFWDVARNGSFYMIYDFCFAITLYTKLYSEMRWKSLKDFVSNFSENKARKIYLKIPKKFYLKIPKILPVVLDYPNNFIFQRIIEAEVRVDYPSIRAQDFHFLEVCQYLPYFFLWDWTLQTQPYLDKNSSERDL